MYKTCDYASDLPQGNYSLVMSNIRSPLKAMGYAKKHPQVDVWYVKEYGKAVIVSVFESRPLIPGRRLA